MSTNNQEIKSYPSGRFTKDEWNEKGGLSYSCIQNAFGQWWPICKAVNAAGYEYQIIIRDSNPFKTLSGAIKFVEKTITRIKNRGN